MPPTAVPTPPATWSAPGVGASASPTGSPFWKGWANSGEEVAAGKALEDRLSAFEEPPPAVQPGKKAEPEPPAETP